MKLLLELTDDEASALSRLTQCMTWNAMREFVITDCECDEMQDAVNKLGRVLLDYGYRHQYGCCLS